MIKKYIVIPVMIIMVSLFFTGCFDTGMFQPAPETTRPPEKEFKTVEELAKAVAAAKADTAAADDQGLKDLSGYYLLKTAPEGATISYIKVSAQAVRVGYTFGAKTAESFDNQMELVWYRKVNTASYIGDAQKTMLESDTIVSGTMQYLRTVPMVNVLVSPTPGTSAEATPTPKTQKYCQFVYWVQDNSAFVSAVPLGFTNDDISKYCVASKVELK